MLTFCLDIAEFLWKDLIILHSLSTVSSELQETFDLRQKLTYGENLQYEGSLMSLTLVAPVYPSKPHKKSAKSYPLKSFISGKIFYLPSVQNV